MSISFVAVVAYVGEPTLAYAETMYIFGQVSIGAEWQYEEGGERIVSEEPLLVTVGPGPEIKSMIDVAPPTTNAPRPTANIEIDIDGDGLLLKSRESESIQFTRGFFVGYVVDFLDSAKIEPECIKTEPSNGWPSVGADRVTVRDKAILINVEGLIVPEQGEFRIDLVCAPPPSS
jgi:hypothetical protein